MCATYKEGALFALTKKEVCYAVISKPKSLLLTWVDKCLVPIYIMLMTVNFLGDLAGFPRMLKFAGVGVFAIAVLRFLIVFDVEKIKNMGNYLAIITIPVVIVLSFSIFVWLFNFVSFADMLSAAERLLVQSINIVVVLGVLYLFGHHAARYTLYAMSLAYGYIVFRAISRFGVSGFVSDLLVFVRSFGVQAHGAMKALEVHDMTFAFGFFVVYYFVAPKEEPRRWLCRILAVVCFILGYKRIAILGVGAALLYHWYYKGKANKTKALLHLGILMFVGCYVYIIISRYAIITTVMNEFGIAMLGRDRLYAFMEPYYDLSIAFPGYGFNFVRTFLGGLQELGISEFETASLHNEIVRQYIECGFWGYLIWSYYELKIRPQWMGQKHGCETMHMYMLCSIFIFATYLTDNTMYYYHTAFIYRLVPLIVAEDYHARKGLEHATRRE